ncbi:MAG: hypothetical protein HPY71_04135 [Firmicutes bacterium]|nr:hypothetical protein [Bacillota bacterium]
MIKTLYGIEVDPSLIWDYRFGSDELMKEDVFVWYLSRVLNEGTYEHVKKIPKEIVRRYLPLLRLRPKVKHFWEWYLASN